MTRRIIDVHIHAYGGGGSAASAYFGQDYTNPLTGDTLSASVDAHDHTRATLAAFDEVGIVKAVVSPGTAHGVAAFRAADPDRVLVGHNPDDFDVGAARAAHAAGMLDVLGEVGVQYQGLAPDDPRLDPVYALAAELDVPIAYHLYAGGPPGRAALGMSRMRGAHGNPLLLEDALERHPTMRLCVMHAGWPMLSEMLALLYAYPQVVVDTGAIAWCQPRAEFHFYLRRLVDAGYTDRILFGSDQMVWPQTIAMAVDAVEDASFLSEGQRQAIFHDNAAEFLQL